MGFSLVDRLPFLPFTSHFAGASLTKTCVGVYRQSCFSKVFHLFTDDRDTEREKKKTKTGWHSSLFFPAKMRRKKKKRDATQWNVRARPMRQQKKIYKVHGPVLHTFKGNNKKKKKNEFFYFLLRSSISRESMTDIFCFNSRKSEKNKKNNKRGMNYLWGGWLHN